MRGCAFLFVLVSACASLPATQIVETRELDEARGAPRIEAVVDLGGRDVPLAGQLDPEGASDGVATIGEALWIRGRSFGRQPTVAIGGRPAAVLARTADAGILVRVPPGTPAGAQPLVVTVGVSSAERAIEVRRLVVALGAGGRVGYAALAPDGPRDAGSLELPAAAGSLCLSADGRAAYVASAAAPYVLSVVELPAAARPRVVYRVELGNAPVRGLSCAAKAHTMLVVRDADFVPLDATSALRPARGAPRPLPEVVLAGRPVRAELAPDGSALAFALEQGNTVALVAIADGRAGATLAVEPDARVPVLVDLAFSPDGKTLWVLTGDTAKSRPAGPQPARVHALRLATPAALELARSVALEGTVGTPARVFTGRARPLASGAAIRLPSERAPVFITGRTRAAGLHYAVLSLGPADQATEAARADLPIGEADQSPDGRWLLAALDGPGGALSLLSTPADGRPGPTRRLELVAAAGSSAAPASSGAVVRVQP